MPFCSGLLERKVAARYARALLGSLPEREAAVPVSKELAVLAAALEKVPEWRAFWFYAGRPAERKQGILRQALADRLSPLTLGFLALLVRQRRERWLPLIARRFEELVQEAEGKVEVQVISAAPLPEPMRAEIGAVVAPLAGKSPELKFLVDDRLLGGMVLRFGDCVLDASVRGRLKRLRSILAGDREEQI